MPTEVVMPQMGESIAEGTIVRWIKKVGDPIDKDEPLFEISTDKVDAEIPSPSAGVLLEIKVKEGETVPVNSPVAVIGAPGERAAAAPGAPAATPSAAAPAAPGSVSPAAPAAAAPVPAPPATPAEPTREDLRRLKSSPVVRKIAKEHGVDIAQLNGTGISGRVTKKDILSYLESPRPAAPAAARPAAPAPRIAPPPAFAPGENVRIEPMGIMRRKIAEHMRMSLDTSAHVYSVYEVDFSRFEAVRQAKRAEFEAAGARLTFTSLIAKATIDTIRQFPATNASLDGDNIVFKRDINLGIAVALDAGLIVPVVKNADERNLLGLCRAIQDLSTRARTKKLNPDDVQGGTFTITNPGIFGALMGFPIISQPQVAILGVGSIDKRVVVVRGRAERGAGDAAADQTMDMIAVRPMCNLTLGYDHRLIDGADAGRFLQALKERIENFEA